MPQVGTAKYTCKLIPDFQDASSAMRAALCVFVAWLSLDAFAATDSVQGLRTQPIPEPTALLVDEAGALTQTERETMVARLKAIQSSGRAQLAVLISRGLGGEPLAEYALRVAEKWELGRERRDDGLLVLVVPSVPAARIEVGYGLEGDIPDARASRWVNELLPAMKQQRLADGLTHLLDQVERALPPGSTSAATQNYLFPDHEEWRLPFVLVVFSPFALFPLMAGRWGVFASAPLLAAFYGGAAWALWDSPARTIAAAAIAFPLPLLWGLNWWDREKLGRSLSYARALGNAIGVVLFFSVITLFVSTGLAAAEPDLVWGGPIFAGLLSIGLAAILFPGKPAHYLGIVLRSAVHFVFMLIVAAVALEPFTAQPGRLACAVAFIVTALIAVGLYLDSHKSSASCRRWSLWLHGVAFALALPFGVLALLLAAGGDDFHTRLVQAAAGSASIASVLALAVRVGLIAAVKIGLGGRFGGGGAGRSE